MYLGCISSCLQWIYTVSCKAYIIPTLYHKFRGWMIVSMRRINKWHKVWGCRNVHFITEAVWVRFTGRVGGSLSASLWTGSCPRTVQRSSRDMNFLSERSCSQEYRWCICMTWSQDVHHGQRSTYLSQHISVNLCIDAFTRAWACSCSIKVASSFYSTEW